MKAFVLDAQTTLAWCFEDESTAATEALLDQVGSGVLAYVPTLWAYEVANALLSAERQKKARSSSAKAETFINRLAALPIETDVESTRHAHGKSIALARQHKLTAYDADRPEVSRPTLIVIAQPKKLNQMNDTSSAGFCAVNAPV